MLKPGVCEIIYHVAFDSRHERRYMYDPRENHALMFSQPSRQIKFQNYYAKQAGIQVIQHGGSVFDYYQNQDRKGTGFDCGVQH